MKEPEQVDPEELALYAGKWVAFDRAGEQEIIAGSGETIIEARAEAKQRGCLEPVFMKVPPLGKNFVSVL